MTAREILKEWLVAHGFDGLAGENCGCGIGDLIVCGQDFSECRPAKHYTCGGKQQCCDKDNDCEGWDGADCWRVPEENGGVFCLGSLGVFNREPATKPCVGARKQDGQEGKCGSCYLFFQNPAPVCGLQADESGEGPECEATKSACDKYSPRPQWLIAHRTATDKYPMIIDGMGTLWRYNEAAGRVVCVGCGTTDSGLLCGGYTQAWKLIQRERGLNFENVPVNEIRENAMEQLTDDLTSYREGSLNESKKTRPQD